MKNPHPYQQKSVIFSWLLLLLCTFLNFCQSPNQPQKTSGIIPPALTSNLHISTILQDSKGNYWFAADGEGVCHYDGKNFQWFTTKDGLRSNYIRTIQEDEEGNLWFGGQGGIVRYDGQTFTPVNPELGLLNSLNSPLNRSKKKLWFGAPNGIYLYDGTGFSLLTLPVSAADRQLEQQAGYNQTPYAIYSFLQDDAGTFWLGTEQRGVFRYDGKNFNQLKEQNLDFPVRTIFQDQKGEFWFGNNGFGLFHYDGKSLRNVTKEKGLTNPGFEQGLLAKNPMNLNLGTVDKLGTMARVWSIAEDQTGQLWIGTIDAGLWRYDGKKLINYTTKDGLPSNRIWTIYVDKNGLLWIGTDGGGLCTYDGKTFTNFILPTNVSTMK